MIWGEFFFKMLLSVCIAVYRHEPAVLLQQLAQQIEAYAGKVEVLVYDDSADSAAFYWHQTALAQYAWLQILTHTENWGRSRVRNQLLSRAEGEYVWFLDGDVTLPDVLLQTYLNRLQTYPAVYCSGLAVPADAPDNFRNFYSRKVEVKAADLRNKQPYRSFTAANFAMPRDFGKQVAFPANHAGYGHEDTHFGLQLLEATLPVRHFDLPVLHAATDNDAVFVAKTKEATENLAKLLVNDPLFERNRQHLKLIRAWEFARNLGLVFLLMPFASLYEKALRSGKRSLLMLNLFKLVVFERAYSYALAAKRRS